MNSLISKYLSLAAIFFMSLAGTYADNAKKEDAQKVITYLLDFVAKSDVIFIRNGESHTPKDAVEHMNNKRDHFKKEIKTPEDFIRLAGTKSLQSGKPYLVKLKDGKEITSEKWLTEALKDYRKAEEIK